MMHSVVTMRSFRPIGALLAGLALTACGGEAPSPSVDPISSAPSASAGVTATPMPTPAPSASAAATAPSSPAGAFDDPQACENEELGYAIEYPGDWWANERIDPDDEALTPIAACQYFAPTAVQLQPNAGLPNGLAIWFRIPEGGMIVGEGDETLSRRETTIDGHDALVVEIVPQPQPGFVPEDSRTYLYAVELGGSRVLVASTDDILQDRATYEASREVLDAMMATIAIDD